MYTVAVPREKYALKQHIAFSYPQWKLIDCDSLDDAADMVIHEKADCFLMGASQALIYDNSQNFKSIPLTKTMEACFAVRSGEGTLLSILNKTLKAMPSDMLTSALAIYDSTADKVTFLDFVKDNMLAFFVTAGFFVLTIISIILVLLRKARKAEAVAKLAANDTQKPVSSTHLDDGYTLSKVTKDGKKVQDKDTFTVTCLAIPKHMEAYPTRCV